MTNETTHTPSDTSIYEMAGQVASALTAGGDFTTPLAHLITTLVAAENAVGAITSAAKALHGAIGDRAVSFARETQRPLAAAYLLTDCLLTAFGSNPMEGA